MKDTYELIDYEADNLVSSNFIIRNAGYIYRNLNQIYINDNPVEGNTYELLLKIIKNDNHYEFITNDCKLDENKNIQSRNNCWFVFKKSKMDNCVKYRIKEGDIIRFGRITTRIKEIKINKITNLNISKSFDNKIIELNKEINNEKINTNDFIGKETESKILDLKKQKSVKLERFDTTIPINISHKSVKISNNKTLRICRICYGEEDIILEHDNPLVQPCKCSGSLKYIHLNCLKQWLNTKSITKVESNNNNNYSIFFVKKIECEICKTKFPDFIKHNETLYEILDFKSEFENYFTLESLTIDKNNNRCIYVVNLNNNIKVKIGRGHEAHLTLSDISVSRVHCIITIDNKNIFLEDNNSKFGTLILVQSRSLHLIENLPLYIQIGRTFLDCRIEKSQNNIFSCCGISEKPNYDLYYKQNENEKQINLLNMFTIKTEIDFSEYEKEKENI